MIIAYTGECCSTKDEQMRRCTGEMQYTGFAPIRHVFKDSPIIECNQYQCTECTRTVWIQREKEGM